MSDNTSSTETRWTTIVSRNQKMKIPPPLKREVYRGNPDVDTTRVLFEDPEILEFLRCQQVYLIVKTALQPGAVIFSLSMKLFQHHADACQCVIDQLSPVVGDGFNPISLRGYRSVIFTQNK